MIQSVVLAAILLLATFKSYQHQSHHSTPILAPVPAPSQISLAIPPFNNQSIISKAPTATLSSPPEPAPAPQPAPIPQPAPAPPPPHKPRHYNMRALPKTCDIKPANKVVKIHGPCITQFAHQPANWDGMQDCWILAFTTPQWGLDITRKALYGDDWIATAAAYPIPAQAAQSVADDFNNRTQWKVSEEWSPDHPYVRLCVPSPCGLDPASGCNLKETDFMMHMNPGSTAEDATVHTFYKAFVRDGKILLPNAGLTAH